MSAVSQLGPVSLQPVRYALRDRAGQWLHFSLERRDNGSLRMTEVTAWRWEGSMAQLQNVYGLHSETVNMEAVKLTPSMSYSSKER